VIVAGGSKWIAYSGSVDYIGGGNRIKLDKLWGIWSNVKEQRKDKHDIYWGCHACSKPADHPVNKCVCSCGAKPGRYSIFWGKDFEGFTRQQMMVRKARIGDDEVYGETYVIGDLKESIVNGKYERSRRPTIRRTKGRNRGRHTA
jgi:hypothetical protein